jgi:4-hydroxy-2-oxoheptanedioate aldolase
MVSGFEHFPARRIARGETVYSAWVTIPEPLVAETAARAGFAAVTMDMQHGPLTSNDIMRCITAAHQNGAAAAIRVPIKSYALASRALDSGASAVIMPMINTVEEARALVSATKYPPLGERSWGPQRAIELFDVSRETYLHQANTATLSLALIETPQALDNLEGILAVEGLDGIFVGPSDLSISLSGGAFVDPADEAVDAAIDFILEQTLEAGKIAAIYSRTPERAKAFVERGFHMVCVGSDVQAIRYGYTMLSQALQGL